MSWQEDNGEREEAVPWGFGGACEEAEAGGLGEGANLVCVSAHLRNQAQRP